MDLPFEETWENERSSIRIFDGSLNEEELKWHFDEEDRVIESNSETDWLFQFDNKIPQPIKGEIKIAKGEWHRLIKGTGKLELRIKRGELY